MKYTRFFWVFIGRFRNLRGVLAFRADACEGGEGVPLADDHGSAVVAPADGEGRLVGQLARNGVLASGDPSLRLGQCSGHED